MPEIKWNATLYDNKHSFVPKYGEEVIEWLQPLRGERILDLGCGTGTLTKKLSETGAIVTGMDAALEMIEKAKQAYPDIEFFVKDATDFLFEEKFDAVFSNATLHWINEQPKALQCIYDNLQPGGRFVFEMGGKHNIESIHNSIKEMLTKAGWESNTLIQSNYFPSVAEQTALLEQVGFRVSDVACFERPTELSGEDGMKNWILQFCTFFFTDIPEQETEQIINNAVAYLRDTNYINGIWYADYVRLRIKAIKPADNAQFLDGIKKL